MTAALISANLSYFSLAFLPPILWLLFYLREDKHPEPKSLLILSFVGGMLSAFLAIFAECLWAIFLTGGSCTNLGSANINPLIIFFGISFIEEYIKYLPVKFLIHKRVDFDEPVDAMIYMMTAALGFAALENAIFSFKIFYGTVENPLAVLPFNQLSLLAGLNIAANRFVGANLLHALSSGMVGFFLARAWFSPYRRHFLALGIFLASVLHTGFNYLILIRETFSQATFYIILLLSTMAVMVFIDFERLKRKTK